MLQELKDNLAPALIASVLVVGAHYLSHMFLHGNVSGVLNPLLISVIVGVVYYVLRCCLDRNLNNSLHFAFIVSMLHFGAHFISSKVFLLDIISNTVIGMAGSVVLASILILEIYFEDR